MQIPGDAEASIVRLRRKLESPGAGGRRVSPTAVAAIDALAATVTHMQEWDLKPSQVAAHAHLHAGCRYAASQTRITFLVLSRLSSTPCCGRTPTT